MTLLIILALALSPLVLMAFLMRAPKRRTPRPAHTVRRKPYTDLTPVVRNLNPQH